MKNQLDFIYFLLTIIINHDEIKAKTWKWKYTLDADSLDNYIVEENSKCRGFYFPEFNDICMMSLYKIRTSEIFFPENGDIYLKEDSDIIFDPNDHDCIKVKPTSYKKWLDPRSWISELPENVAVPHLERIPCQCDDVVFPNSSLYAVSLPSFRNVVKRVQFGVTLPDNSCPLKLSPEGTEGIVTSSIFCDDLTCQNTLSNTVLNEMCSSIENIDREGAECTEGVELIGHCTKFCGAVIRLRENSKTDPAQLLGSFINNDMFDVYHSYVLNNSKRILQISVTDKGRYTGYSALKIAENEDKIRAIAKENGILNMEIFISGTPNNNQNAKHAFLVIFGCLMFVLLIFGIIYGIYEQNLIKIRYNFLPRRLNLSRYNQALRRSVIFSRFENTENVSIAGSVLSLEREEFSNPLYEEQPVAGTSKNVDLDDELSLKDDEEKPQLSNDNLIGDTQTLEENVATSLEDEE